jgi:hypothetical protein
MLWAEAASDAFERSPGRDGLGAKMQVDHKMVNRAPGMAISLLCYVLTAWNHCINYVQKMDFAVQQKYYRSATKEV